MLRQARDLQSVAYLLGAPGLALWQWHQGFSALLYLAMAVMWIGVGVIHHNHSHLPLWRARWLNRATDGWLSALQGHPGFVFRVSHNANHHRYRHGPRDVARTYRFAGGDTNSLMGYLLHPCQVARVLYPLFWRHLRRLRRGCPAEFRAIGACYGLVMVLWLVAASLSPAKALLYLVLPQLIALHWLLGANYLQHAHADGLSRWNYARNFEGAVVNRLYFNIGLHTAHHEHPGLHWSRLPVAHAALRARIHPQLLEPGLLRYVARVYLGSLVRPRWRSRSLQAPLVSWLPCPVALPSSSAAPPSA